MMTVEKLIEKASIRAQSAAGSLTRYEMTDVSYENDKLKSVGSEQGTRMEIRVIVDGKVGSSHTTDADDIDGVVSRALEAAEFGSPAHYVFPGSSDLPDVKLFDADVPDVPKQEMVDIGGEMLAMIKEYNSDILVGAGAWKRSSQHELATSAGASCSMESTGYGLHVYGQLVRGTDMLWAGDSLDWRTRRIDHQLIARNSIARFRMAENAATVESGDMPVIFTPEGMAVLNLALVMGINGKNVSMGDSPLAGRLGETIADQRLTIIDDPLIDYAPGSDRIDDDGVACRATPIVENGVLRNFLYDLDAAGRAEAESTGNGVGCNPTNLVVAEGDTSLQRMIADTKEGLLVHDVLGLGQGNVISGAFSVNVQLGYKIENGEVVGRVKDVMLAGNAYDAVKEIAVIGDKAEWTHGMFGGASFVPPVKIGKLSVVAKTGSGDA